MHYLYLAIAIVSEVIATTALKSSDRFTNLWPTVICLIGYCSAVFFLQETIRPNGIKLGLAYAMWTGLGMVLVTVSAFFVYGQKLDMPAVVGILLIISGVLVINLFAHVEGH